MENEGKQFIIEARGASKFYSLTTKLKPFSLKRERKKIDVLNDLSIKIEPGKINILFGPSGSGKTTLLKCLSLLEKFDSGNLNIQNKMNGDIHYRYAFPSKIVNKIQYPFISIVFQHLLLWPHLTNRQNIVLALGDQIHERNEELAMLIDKFQMTEFIDKYPNQSSQGQKQRVAIARAVILRPKILFLDEITSALDYNNIKNVFDVLTGIKEKSTLLLVTHDLYNPILKGDYYFFLCNGGIIESGTDILTNPSTKKLKKYLNLNLL